jgi:hypothetical protein
MDASQLPAKSGPIEEHLIRTTRDSNRSALVRMVDKLERSALW